MRTLILGLVAIALAGPMTSGQEEALGGGGLLLGTLTMDFAELNAALAATGHPELPDQLLLTGGGGWGGTVDGPVFGGLGLEGSVNALAAGKETAFRLQLGGLTVEQVRRLDQGIVLGAGAALGGGTAELTVRSRQAVDFSDALAQPTASVLSTDLWAALLYLRLQLQPLDWLGLEGWLGYLVSFPSRWQEGGRELAGPRLQLRAPFVGVRISFGGFASPEAPAPDG
ncbi:MAG: hypothetical protein ACP5G2_02140 [Candidatus Bipolaricaulaceae bacterium]